MTVPRWATEIVQREAPGAVFRWRWSRRPKASTGYAYDRGDFVVTASQATPHSEVKMVLLHELAHHLLPPKLRHGVAFWRLFSQLCDKYAVPMRMARHHARRKAAGRSVFT